MAVGIKAASILIENFWAAGLRPMLWGAPGIGKTELAEALAASKSYNIPQNDVVADLHPILAETYGRTFKGRPCLTVSLQLYTQASLTGIPVYDPEAKTAFWASTDQFPTSPNILKDMEGRLVDMCNRGTPAWQVDSLARRIARALHMQHCVLLLDEITQAPQSVQAAAFDLVWKGTVGTYTLPPDTLIIAAGNRSGDRAATQNMPSPMRRRLKHIDLEPRLDEWIEWAEGPGDVDSDVIGYVRFRPGSEGFWAFDPKTMGNTDDFANITWPCPATWSDVSKLIKVWKATDDADDRLMQAAISGIIGAGHATEFVAWRRCKNKLPDATALLDGHMDEKALRKYFVNEQKKPDLSLEFAYLMSCVDVVIGEERAGGRMPIEITKPRIERLFDFCAKSMDNYDNDATSLGVEFGMICFQKIFKKRFDLAPVLSRMPQTRRWIEAANSTGALIKDA